jgi:hypothetical protein
MNMPRENFIEDFEYLMTALEENWPFFELSKSAKGIDVHELANDFREKLNDPDFGITNPHEFLDQLRIHFIRPVDITGSLGVIWDYNSFFNILMGFIPTEDYNWMDFVMNIRGTNLLIFTRPETLLFYSTLRDAGGTDIPPIIRGNPFPPRMMEVDVDVENSIGFLTVHTMISRQEDYRGDEALMRRYEAMAMHFLNSIVDLDHLIIDLRDNVGGRGLHDFFDFNIVAPIISRPVRLPGYLYT